MHRVTMRSKIPSIFDSINEIKPENLSRINMRKMNREQKRSMILKNSRKSFKRIKMVFIELEIIY